MTQKKTPKKTANYQKPLEAVDVTQGQGDVHKHNGVADNYDPDVAIALSLYFIFNTPLCTIGYSQVGVCEVFHEPDESEINTHTKYSK